MTRTVAYEIAKESDYQSLLSYIFPIIKYHSTWKSFSLKKTPIEYDYHHGQYAVYKCKKFTTDPRSMYNDISEPTLSETSLYWYEKISELCRENDIKLLFVEMPAEDWSLGKHNVISKLSDSLGADFLDYNYGDVMELCGLSWSGDFYNGYHLNTKGSIKASAYLGNYIKQQYDLNESSISKKQKNQIEKDVQEFKYEQANTQYVEEN